MHKWLIVWLIFLLPGCGFHLRGDYQIPQSLKNVYLQGESAELHEVFSKTVQASSGQLLKSQEKAGTTIKFFNESMNRRVLSLSARGRANDFELVYRLEYELAAGNAVVLPRQSIEVRREYYNDQQDIIAKDNEEVVIRNEMYQQAVRAIINRARMALETNAKLK
ncbi:MAG: hypothetical protein HOP23_05360 [Methylococcaceae bacterium]|nr:hypothetical protein [Methylococcaceae bacterium]